MNQAITAATKLHDRPIRRVVRRTPLEWRSLRLAMTAALADLAVAELLGM